MIFYEVSDGDEYARYHTTKAAAIADARRQNEGTDPQMDFQTVVYLVDIGKPTKERICLCLQGEGFAVRYVQIYPKIKTKEAAP